MSSFKSVVTKLFTALPVAGTASTAMSSYPEKPIRLIVPFPPGGAGDAIARSFTTRMGELLKQPIVVDFKGGAATIVGTEAARVSAPDGYTLLLGSATTFTINPVIYRKLPYDP